MFFDLADGNIKSFHLSVCIVLRLGPTLFRISHPTQSSKQPYISFVFDILPKHLSNSNRAPYGLVLPPLLSDEWYKYAAGMILFTERTVGVARYDRQHLGRTAADRDDQASIYC